MAFYGNYSSLYPSASPLPEREDPYPTGYYRPHHFPSHTQVMMPGASSAYGPNLCSFPVGTDANVVYAFQMVDRDRSGCIDESELQLALSSGYQRFNRRTIKLLMFLYRNPTNPARFGPEEFTGLWSCLRQWRAIFGRFDRDCSGNIDLVELRDALHSIGYALPPSVLQLLISRYNDGSGRRTKLNFDNFVECGMIVKGLTEGFKKKDVRFSGSATVSYDTFMSMVIPYLVSYN